MHQTFESADGGISVAQTGATLLVDLGLKAQDPLLSLSNGHMRTADTVLGIQLHIEIGPAMAQLSPLWKSLYGTASVDTCDGARWV